MTEIPSEEKQAKLLEYLRGRLKGFGCPDSLEEQTASSMSADIINILCEEET